MTDTVHGKFQHHHLWEYGMFPGTYPRGFLMHAIRILQGKRKADSNYMIPMQFYCFVNQTVQLYGYLLDTPCSLKQYTSRKGKHGIRMDMFTLHMEDGELQRKHKTASVELLEWGPVSGSEEHYPHQVMLHLESHGMRLHFGGRLPHRANLMYGTTARWDDVWTVGTLEGTWKNKEASGYGLVNFGTHQSTANRVSSILSLMEFQPEFAVTQNQKAPSREQLVKSLSPSGPTTSQKTVCVLFWLIPLVLLGVVIFMLVVLFKSSGVSKMKQVV